MNRCLVLLRDRFVVVQLRSSYQGLEADDGSTEAQTDVHRAQSDQEDADGDGEGSEDESALLTSLQQSLIIRRQGGSGTVPVVVVLRPTQLIETKERTRGRTYTFITFTGNIYFDLSSLI